MNIKGSVFTRFDCDKDHPETDGNHIERGPKKCPVTWWARIRYIDPETNKPKDLQRRADSRADAIDKRDREITTIKQTAGRSVGSERMSFADLCAYYARHYVKEAEYVDDRKVEGLRSWYTVSKQVDVLKDYFAGKPLRSLTHGGIEQFKKARLKAKTRDGRQRSIASVNRELALLRRMLNVAKAEGWIIESPFKQGQSLISSADERKRERIITQTEEIALLKACEAPKRGHLRAIIIAALDTGCRRGELLKLRWSEVNLETGQITIIARNSKTARPRSVAMTGRLKAEIERLKSEAHFLSEEKALVFGGLQSVKKSFVGARTDAGLPDLRFHDLRHSAATRLVGGHLPLSEVGRILGHSQPQTTYRYVNANAETAQRAANVLDQFNAAPVPDSTTATEFVN